MARMNGGQAVVESLIAQGVDTVFGLISVHTLQIFDALREAAGEGRVRYIGGRHEHALAYMADGYARASGRPGVLITSCGPGAANSLGSMGEAYHSSVPLLQITTEVEHEWINKGKGRTHNPKNQLTMFASVTDWNSLVESVEAIPDHIAGAIAHLRTHHPRPAVVEIPTDFLGQEADVEIPALEVERPKPDPAAVANAVQLLKNAKRPVLWGGSGVMNADATQELRELAELLDAPVVTGGGGKGAFPEDHPLSLRTALGGGYYGPSPIHDFIASCDVAMVVGSSLPFTTTKGSGVRFPEQLIHIDVDPEMIERTFPVGVGVIGDAKRALRQIVEGLGGERVVREAAFHKEITDLQSKTYAAVKEQLPSELRLWEGVRSLLNRDAVVVTDATMPAYAAPRCFPVYEPRTLFGPHGWGGIGYGFPASLGAKAAVPDRQVVCVVGDGSFQYNFQELGSAVQYGLSPVVLLFNDNAWGALKGIQAQDPNGGFFGVDLQNPDFCKLAGAYGIEATRVDNLGALLAELKRALTSDRIQFIEVMTPDGIAKFQ
jgi:acetolactate synthase-1/2/3 large subunit